MIRISNLINIPLSKRMKTIDCLDNLILFKDKENNLSPIISGYNWYVDLPLRRNMMFTFSNIHETEPYKRAMLRDLEKREYISEIITERIIQKSGAFLWDPANRIRDDNGGLFNIQIKDLRTGLYLSLENYGPILIKHNEFLNSKGYLLAEGHGWEIDIPFKNENELINIADLFLKKSGMYNYDEEGITIKETDEEILLRSPWPDAYRTPVLIIGEGALKYIKKLPYFGVATKFSLTSNNNEISFIIHKNLATLKNLPAYDTLKEIGFVEEFCLGNKPFLRYIDEVR